MIKQLIFAITLFITLGIFSFTSYRLFRFFRLTRSAFPISNIPKRLKVTLEVAFGQTKIFRRPFTGLLHALVFWGFLVILFGSIEMIIDGLFGSERVLQFLGPLYNGIIASGDVFALIVALAISIFLARRLFFHIKRFQGIEMKHVSHLDANIALTLILLLMLSLLGMNTTYVVMAQNSGMEMVGVYPVSTLISELINISNQRVIHFWYELFWWMHILLIFLFINILPYSKHFHVFMSIPNVFFSRLEPLGKLTNMDDVTREVRMMLDPNAAFESPANTVFERFGVKDVEDVSWKNYLDSLACTECGRCTAVCPANLTGKRLSPRKIMMEVRARMKEKGPGMVKKGRDFTDGRSLIRDYITEEELWACTTCNACARECPININHPSLIIDMRRYLVMEEASAPGELKAMFGYLENNGAPWQFSQADRMLWAENIEINANKQ